MSTKSYIAAVLTSALLVLPATYDDVIADSQSEVGNLLTVTEVQEVKPASAYERLSHQQRVWMGALEWCESRGKKEAVNPNDVDNTPSYYSFQFKPSTFKEFGEKYEVLSKGLTTKEVMEKMKDHSLQQEIVAKMITDKKVNLRNQFPACTRSLGLPDRTPSDQEMAYRTSKEVKVTDTSLAQAAQN